MAVSKLQESRSSAVWRLVERQHGVVTRAQLLTLGLSPHAVQHRLATGRLHALWRGVYAVGRPELSAHGVWMAAVLACGPRAALSHTSAAALWRIEPDWSSGPVHVSVPSDVARRRPRISVHRSGAISDSSVTRAYGIPVTEPVLTLVNLAACLDPDPLERAINGADRLALVDPETLRSALERYRGVAGAGTLRRILDRRTFSASDSTIERVFSRMVRRLRLPPPVTQQWVNGFRVDFYWPELGLVVETDGLTYHRTPAQQTSDRLRDQAHAAAGLTTLRFTRAQIQFELAHVERTLSEVIRRLQSKD
jgi:very-short-patch-repair endonuclease